MKKVLLLLVALLFSVVLVACGDSNTTTEKGNNGESEVANVEEKAKNEDETSDKISDTSFDDGDYVYEIKEIEQMEGKYEDGTQILAIELSFTNNTDEPISPWMSLGINAEQETEATVETLNGANGLFPDDYKADLVKMGDTDVKPSATVDAVIGYEILYPGEPIKLTNFNFADEELFERVVETTEK